MNTTELSGLEKIVKELEEAKRNTQRLLDSPNSSINMKGLGYWANEVERLRELISNNL